MIRPRGMGTYVPKPRSPRFNEQQLRAAIAVSFNWTEALRKLDYCPTGGNPGTVKKYAARWGIGTEHFDADLARHRGISREPIPLDEVLVQGSRYTRGTLKRRLYAEGIKQRRCELCGQGDEWLGRPMALILDHINGVRDDHRLENLQIVCPNCAATLPTHCGRGLREPRKTIACERCGANFLRSFKKQRYCSRGCGQLASSDKQRRARRPPYDELIREIDETSYCAVARKYGVSDNAVRKWVKAYEREEQAGGQTA